MSLVILVPAVCLVAACYAAVGLGGGTAYLSLLSLAEDHPDALRPVAWSLNVLAASVAFVSFRAKAHFDARGSAPCLAGGIVGGALGALLPIAPGQFRIVLGGLLLAVGIDMLLRRARGAQELSRLPSWSLGLSLGFAIGVLSGIAGIGGGIVLGPVLLALRFGPTKTISALSALFIVLSSAGSLGAHLISGGAVAWGEIAPLAGAVVVGAFFGSRYGAGKASPKAIRRIFSVLVLAAGTRLLLAAAGLGFGSSS